MNKEDRILAIDVGGGTQDILVFDASQRLENCVKMVLPSQTQVVATKIHRATKARKPIHLTGHLMGGGASADAVRKHLDAGLPVTSTAAAAMTVHNDLDRVTSLGVTITERHSAQAITIEFGDVDLAGIRTTLSRFEIAFPETIAIAVQDHGYDPASGGREHRANYLERLLNGGGDASHMMFQQPPPEMTRMQAVVDAFPGALVMDTGAAAVLGSLDDPVVSRHAVEDGAILINIGNLHTFAVAYQGTQIHGLFEHHTSGVTPEWLSELVGQLKSGTLTREEVARHGGHGAAFRPDFSATGRYNFVAVTGPNRVIASGLGYHQAAPNGDMMLSGPYGLVRATQAFYGREN